MPVDATGNKFYSITCVTKEIIPMKPFRSLPVFTENDDFILAFNENVPEPGTMSRTQSHADLDIDMPNQTFENVFPTNTTSKSASLTVEDLKNKVRKLSSNLPPITEETTGAEKTHKSEKRKDKLERKVRKERDASKLTRMLNSGIKQFFNSSK